MNNNIIMAFALVSLGYYVAYNSKKKGKEVPVIGGLIA